MEHVPRVLILEHVWEYAFSGNASVLDTYISCLRQKVDRSNHPSSTPS
jgi:DNA-binding response OmpR family regulator